MRSLVIAILSTACVANAFWLPQPSHSDVRLPHTALQSARLSAWEITKRNIKYTLVPNAKQAPLPPEDAAPEPSVSAAVVPTPEVLPVVPTVPVVPEVPQMQLEVPEVVPSVQVPRMEQASHPDVNTVVHSMQDSYKNVLKAMHDSPMIPGHTPSLAEYIKQGKNAGSGEAVQNKLMHLPSLNFEALKHMQPTYFEALKKSIGSGIFSTTGSEGMAMGHILRLKFDQMMSSVSGTGATIPQTVDKFTTSFQNLGALLQKDGYVSAKEAADALDLDELGAYYFGIIVLFVVISQNGSGGGGGSVAAAADVPAQNITAAIETGVVVTQSDTMTGQIIELTKAITAMSKEMKILQGEKATRDYKIATMKSDSRSLRNELDSSESFEGSLKVALKRMEKEKNAMSKEVEKLKKETDDLRKKLDAATSGATVALPSAVRASPKKAAKKAAKKMSPAPMPEPVVASPAPAPVAKASPAKESKAAPEKTSPAPTISVVYDAPAKLAYDTSDKSMAYGDFKTKYEADAIADVIAKKNANVVAEVTAGKASAATKPVVTPVAPTPVAKTSPVKESKAASAKTSPAPMSKSEAASPAHAPEAKTSPAKESKEAPEKTPFYAPFVKASPVKASSERASPVKAASEKASPVKATSEKASPVKAASERASPVKAASEKASPAPIPKPVAASPVPAPVVKASPVKAAPEKASPAPMPKPVSASPAPAPFFSSVAAAGARGVEKPFFSSITEPSTPAAEAAVKGSPKKGAKKAPKKVITKKDDSKATEVKETVVASSKAKGVLSTESTKKAAGSDDWSHLSPSALQRKTVKALTEYLISKGASVTDTTGATLKKSELLEVVRSQELVRSP